MFFVQYNLTHGTKYPKSKPMLPPQPYGYRQSNVINHILVETASLSLSNPRPIGTRCRLISPPFLRPPLSKQQNRHLSDFLHSYVLFTHIFQYSCNFIIDYE